MILLYHLVFPDDTPKDAWNAGLILRLSGFKRQIHWLKKRYEILPLEHYVSAYLENPAELKGKYALTFDDGYQRVFDLVSPFLIEEDIPATFFATTSHLEDGGLLWFVYINALCSERSYSEITIEGQRYPLNTRRSSMFAWRKLIDLARASGKPIEFAQGLTQRYPLPENITQKYLGFSDEQLGQIGQTGNFLAGGHTHQHPYLDQISKDSQIEQMKKNKNILENLTGNPVEYFAYTGGVYNGESISAVKQVGFNAAFAIKPKGLSTEKRFEVPRMDIYSPSMLKFRFKVLGMLEWVNLFLRRS